VPGGGVRRYHGFVSYSADADLLVASALQKALQHLARPWSKRHALEVFREGKAPSSDEAWSTSIDRAMDDSEWFVLLASPESARSQRVGHEISYWVQTRGVDRLMPVVTGGDLVWDPVAGDLDWSLSTAAHPALRGIFTEVPRHIDLSWTRNETDLSLRNARFRDAVAEIAAPMHGVSKDELESEEIHQHRRTRRLVRVAVAALAALTALAIAGGATAIVKGRETVRQRDRAIVQARLATAANLAGEVEGGQLSQQLDLLLAVRAYEMDPAAGRPAMWTALHRVEESEGQQLLRTSDQHLSLLAPNGHTYARESESSVGISDVAVADDGSMYVVRDTDSDTYRLVGSEGEQLRTLADIAPSLDPALAIDPAVNNDSTSGDTAGLRSFEFSSSAERVLSLDGAGVLRAWQTSDGGLLYSLPNIRDFEQLPDGLVLLSQDALTIADPLSGAPLNSRPASTISGRSVASNGRLLALGTSGGRVLVTTVDNAAVLLDIDVGVGPVIHLALSSDGQLLAVTGPTTYAVFDVSTGARLLTDVAPLLSFRQFSQPSAVAFDESGGNLVVGADEIVTTSLDVDKWKNLACSIAGRDLTDEEFATYVGGAFEVTCE
jgi:TIR domain